MEVTAHAPGRVVLIGDHTDYTGGLVCAMAIDRWTTISGSRVGSTVSLHSADELEPLTLQLPVSDPQSVVPPWGRYIAGVAAELGAARGLVGSITTSIPIGAGVSSSAALEVACALALGFEGSAAELARLCQRAENRATGLPSGVLDQLTISCAVEDHVLMLDCASLHVAPVPFPESLAVQVLFVAQRQLVGSPYADRVAQCRAAEAAIGPLRVATLSAVDALEDPLLRRRARHVVTENQRVRDVATALHHGDAAAAGQLMLDGHESLRADFETSTPAMDHAVQTIRSLPGVHGVRMTGGGFGGCVVALTEPGVEIPGAWRVRPAGPAALGALPTS